MFTLKSDFKPTGDQPQAIDLLERGINAGLKNQTLLGVTGSGKTFTMANVIANTNLPTLIISHNKTLAGQLYQEMRDFFPEDPVSYFVSYYDYYQPEAYIPASDTYIEKEAQINDTIDKLRLQATTNLMTKNNVITIASVSCIYNIGSPKEYGNFIFPTKLGDSLNIKETLSRLVELQYERSEYEFARGSFRVRGNSLDIYPAYQDFAYRLSIEEDKLISIIEFDPLTGKKDPNTEPLDSLVIYPAKHYLLDPDLFNSAESQIRSDLEKEVNELKKRGKLVEAQRLNQRTNYDLEIIKEIGYVNGIENYSRYFDGRKPGERPYSLLDYYTEMYGTNWLCIIDESHMTIPQIRGMYNGDHSRKLTLIDNGFRLKAALDNRPLKFDEFYSIPPHLIHVSATPDSWEIDKSTNDAKSLDSPHKGIVEQLIRPTGIVDPEIEIRPSDTEIDDVIEEIVKRANKKERTLVTTLTKKTAEDLTEYLKERGIRANYLHSDIKTLERSDILDKLRKNEFDALIGVNLLREGLDLPEVTLVAILDADKEGFLRSRVSLIQTMGRAARNVNGKVILYAMNTTKSMRLAIKEILRRREYQISYNIKHNITPSTISKPIREKIVDVEESTQLSDSPVKSLSLIKSDSLTPHDLKKLITKLEKDMRKMANDLRFEDAIAIRDKIRELKGLKL